MFWQNVLTIFFYQFRWVWISSIFIYSHELNHIIATRDLDNHQATKLRVCTLVVFSAGGRKHLHTIINKNHGLFTKGRSMVMYAIKTSEPVIQSGISSRTCTSLSINASPLRVNSSWFYSCIYSWIHIIIFI